MICPVSGMTMVKRHIDADIARGYAISGVPRLFSVETASEIRCCTSQKWPKLTPRISTTVLTFASTTRTDTSPKTHLQYQHHGLRTRESSLQSTDRLLHPWIYTSSAATTPRTNQQNNQNSHQELPPRLPHHPTSSLFLLHPTAPTMGD